MLDERKKSALCRCWIESLSFFGKLSSIPILLSLMLFYGCSTTPNAVEPPAPLQKAQQDRSREIFVVNHGWHTGIAIESGALNREIPALAVRFPAGKYYELGWGDADFYRAGEGTTGLALRAIFWSSGSVLRVASFSESPLLCFRGCDVRKIAVSQEGYSRLVEFIVSSFRTGPNGEIIPDAAAFGTGDSQFYSATGRYHAFNTCNKWTAKALYSAGLDIGTAFVVSASGVMDSLPETPDSR